MNRMKKTALITGGSRGIGLAIKELFIGNGIEAIAPSRNELDLLSDSSINSYISLLNRPVDILVNNAGINPLSELTGISDNDMHETIQVNLLAPMRLMRALTPMMIERKFGRVVNISSIWSAISKPRRVSYSVSKSGINALTRSAAIELAKYNVLINAVAPGFVNTELTSKNNTDEELKKIADAIPIGRLAEACEIAELVLFLCSEKNNYITGQTVFIDGGFSCQ